MTGIHERTVLPAVLIAALLVTLTPGDVLTSRHAEFREAESMSTRIEAVGHGAPFMVRGSGQSSGTTSETSPIQGPSVVDTPRPFMVTLSADTRWDAFQTTLEELGAGGSVAGGKGPAEAHTTGSDGLRSVPGSSDRDWALAAAFNAAEQAQRDIELLVAPVADAVELSGGTIVSRYDTAAAGLLVHVTLESARQIADIPGVALVQPAPIVSVQLLDSVPGVGASRVHQELGVAGEGATVAVVDTGVDYTHATLGGAGVPEAYEAALRDAESTGDTWQDRPLFPNDKVIAGYDFAGALYDPNCTAAAEGQGLCSSVPAPDPDPLDTHGHGTHVSSIVAGLDAAPVGSGVAPGANIVSLKIFGSSGSTDLIIDPIEWAIEANMGMGDRPHIDVLNLSLGQRYGAEIRHEEEAVRRAVDAGIVVVASVGNESYLPFIAAAPGIAADALAVASHNPPGQHTWTATLSPAQGPPVSFGADAVFHLAWSPDPRADLSAEVVYVGRGCPGNGAGDTRDPYLTDPNGRIAMFDLAWGAGGSSCTADRQALRAQDAGAVGVLVAMGMGLESASYWDGYPIIDIPAWTVNQRLESAIRELSPDETPAFLNIGPLYTPDRDGVVSEFSSRGPARTGALKPNLSAPGAGVFAAALGQGHRGISHSGTSMAAPHVAGAAALVWSRARSESVQLTARDVAAALITTADPTRVHQSVERHTTPPVARTGSGALDAYRAASSGSGVRAGTLADMGMGLMALSEPVTRALTVEVTNRLTVPVTYDLAARFRAEDDLGKGLELVAQDGSVTVEAGASVMVPVTASIVPAELPDWDLLGGAAVGDVDALATSELDGWLEVAQTGTSITTTARVPFYLLARRASEVAATWRDDEASGDVQLNLRNDGSFPGDAEVFELVAVDAPDPALPSKIDVDAVGVRAIPDGQGNTVVEFLVHTRGTRVHPLETATEIDLDTDLDGRTDYLVYSEDEAFLRTRDSRNGRVKAALDEPGGSPFGSPTARFFANVDLNSRFTGLPIVIEDTGLTPSTLHFRFRVRQRDFVEDNEPTQPLYDQLPDGGGWLTFDARSRGMVPSETHRALDGHAGAEFTMVAPPEGGGFLAVFPNNAPGPGDISIWPEPEEQQSVLLPWVGHRALLD